MGVLWRTTYLPTLIVGIWLLDDLVTKGSKMNLLPINLILNLVSQLIYLLLVVVRCKLFTPCKMQVDKLTDYVGN